MNNAGQTPIKKTRIITANNEKFASKKELSKGNMKQNYNLYTNLTFIRSWKTSDKYSSTLLLHPRKDQNRTIAKSEYLLLAHNN